MSRTSRRHRPLGRRGRVALHAAVWGFVAASTVTAVAQADQTTDLEALLDEPVVATASHGAEDQRTAPATSTTVTAEDLRRYGIRTLDEALEFLSLGMAVQRPLRGVEVGARGVLLTGDFNNHVLLLVNGHAVNEQWYGTSYVDRGAGIPMEMIDRIEIVLGPGSVMYGSYAMLGVVHVVTKQAKDYTGLHLVGESEVGARREGTTAGFVRGGPLEATSGRLGVGYGKTFELWSTKGEVTAHVEYSKQRGPAYRFGPQNVGADAVTGTPKQWSPSGGDGIWGGVTTRAAFADVPTAVARLVIGSFELNTRATMYRRGTPYPNQVNLAATDFDEPRSREEDRFLSIDLKHTATMSSRLSLLSRVYADSYRYELARVLSATDDCGLTAPGGCTIRSNGRADWAGLELRGSYDWARDGRFVTTAGADGRVRSIGSSDERTETATGARGPITPAISQHDKTLGLYVQQVLRPHPLVGGNLGIRSDIYEEFGVKTSPRAAATVSPWAGATLKSVYASAFRAPSMYESTYTEVPGAAPTSLRPESVRSIEGSFEQRFGTHRVLVGAFRSWWSDLILYKFDSAAAVGAYGNYGSIDNYGFHVGYDGSTSSGRLRMGINVTGARSRRVDETTQLLPASPSVFGNARVAYDVGGRWPTVAAAGSLVGATLADRAPEGGFTPTPFAPTRAVLRLVMTGPTGAKGLSYRVMGTYTSATTAPYVVGPVQAATPEHPSAELAPVDRFRTAVGLQYDLP